MNAGVSHTAPGRLAIAGPPSGPTRPARSSAPENARRGAASAPPANDPSPAPPSVTYATAALLVTPAPFAPFMETPACLALEMASVSAATQCCSAALDSASST